MKKKLSILLILMLTLSLGTACGKKKTAEAPKETNKPQTNGQTQDPKNNPHNAELPPATPEDKAALEKSMKDFWVALNDGDEAKINAMIYKSEKDTAKNIKEGLDKAEVKSFEFKKVTGVTANNGLGAVGYIVLREMGVGMKNKFPEIQVLPFVKDKDQWKIVLSQDAVTQEEVGVLTNMIMQEQKKLSDDPDSVEYQEMQKKFEAEAKATNQKFYQEAVKAQEEAQKQQGAGGAQKPSNHP